MASGTKSPKSVYPITPTFDDPDRPLNRTVFFYQISTIPIAITSELPGDAYRSTDGEAPADIEMPYRYALKLSRGSPLLKWLLLIPHHILLLFLGNTAGSAGCSFLRLGRVSS